MMLTKRIHNKGRKLLAMILSALLILSLGMGMNPKDVHAEGETTPDITTQDFYIVTLLLKFGDKEADPINYESLSLYPVTDTSVENEFYPLHYKKAKVPAGDYFFYYKDQPFVKEIITIGTETDEWEAEPQNGFTIHLSWVNAPEKCEHFHSDEWIVEPHTGTHFHECIFCGERLDETPHDTSGEWLQSENQHWKHCSVCNIDFAHEDHTFGDWVITKEATTDETGIKTQACIVCGYTISESIPVLPPPEPVHTHKYILKHDATHHWQECTATEGTCSAPTIDKTEHNFDKGVVVKEATEEATGEKTFTCLTCGYKKTETIPKLEHVHKFGTEWISDGTSHWHVCKCGAKNDTNKHTASDWIVDKKPTATTIGSQHKECTICKKLLETKEIPKLVAPKIIKGGGQIYEQRSKKDLTLTCSDNLENLTGVYVANGLVHKSNYYVDTKAQTLSFKSNYLDSLGGGTHTIKLAFSNGTSTETTMTIHRNGAVKTGDTSNYIPLVILLIISIGVLITTSVLRKRGLNG